MSESAEVKAYAKALATYRTTLYICSQCVENQNAIDTSYDNLKEAYAKMTPEEQGRIKLPKNVPIDDGTGGLFTGWGKFYK